MRAACSRENRRNRVHGCCRRISLLHGPPVTVLVLAAYPYYLDIRVPHARVWTPHTFAHLAPLDFTWRILFRHALRSDQPLVSLFGFLWVHFSALPIDGGGHELARARTTLLEAVLARDIYVVIGAVLFPHYFWYSARCWPMFSCLPPTLEFGRKAWQ